MPKTLADFPDFMRRHHAHAGHGFDPAHAHTDVFAPCCGRKTAADSILDVRGIVTVVSGGGHQAPRDHDFLCCGCRFRLVHEEGSRWTWSALWSAVGEHPEIVRHHRAREIAAAAAHEEQTAGRAYNPDVLWHAALTSLPPGIDPHRRAR